MFINITSCGYVVDFLAAFVEPNMKKEKVLLTTLTKTITKLRPELVEAEEEDEEEGDGTDHLPFVCQKFNVIGNMK